MMTAARRQTVRDLAEEAKKRAVLFVVFAFGLAYLMSLTSSSVWINLPVATAMIILFRYLSLDLDFRRKSTTNNKDPVVDPPIKRRHVEPSSISPPKNGKSDWRKKVDSLPVEAAFEQFTRHLVSEWVTDLWYSRITPDREGPEELINIINSILGEISVHARNVNLINLLTRDIIDLVCSNLELYQFCQAKIGKENFVKLPTERRDLELKLTLVAQNKLHPALFSANAEHKVLQSLADGLISITCKPEDLKCSFFRYTARELLACAVVKPVLNLANPRFINERIESLALSYANKAAKRVIQLSEEAAMAKQREHPMPSVDELSALMDRSSPGVELVQFRHNQPKSTSDAQLKKTKNPSSLKPNSSNTHMSNILHPLNSSVSAPSSHIRLDAGYSLHSQNNSGNIIESSGVEGAQNLDMVSKRRNQALAPEHLESMWTKGKHYKVENGNCGAKQSVRTATTGTTSNVQQSVVPHGNSTDDLAHTDVKHMEAALSHFEDRHLVKSSAVHTGWNNPSHLPNTSSEERTEHASYEEVGLDSESSYATEDDENNNVTGLDSPGTRVWESKSKGNVVSSHIHHPLESSDLHRAKKNRSRSGNLRISRNSSGRRRSRSSGIKVPLWQEVERTSFVVGDGLDILNTSANYPRTGELSDDTEVDNLSRIFSGTDASLSLTSNSDSSYSSNYSTTNVLADSFLKLRCEVIGANIVKSGSGMFAVYSVAVTDANSNSWSIKRRFRHFEELHRRLKEFPDYNLSLPPKHFLSSGLEVPVVRERCKLLDIYLKKLVQIPTVSGSIEVWDFLSVDSQTYIFLDSLSIIQTLSVNSDDKPTDKGARLWSSAGALDGHIFSTGQESANIDDPMPMDKNYIAADGLRLRKGSMEQDAGMNAKKRHANLYQDYSGSDYENIQQNDFSFSIKAEKPKKVLPEETNAIQEASQFLEADGYLRTSNEWMPPNLSVSIFHLVDVVFQLHDGGWIRRQAFWVAKQILQLGMGDTFDDWLVEKIQLLRKGSVIASLIQRVEQILWPDGIFMTKHPKRRPATSVSSPNAQNNGLESSLTDEQQLEAGRRATFVRELIIDKAPTALVSLVGRKEYERCAQDIYFFLQSQLCLKQLAFELLELLVLAVFPELNGIVRQWNEQKEQFQDFGLDDG